MTTQQLQTISKKLSPIAQQAITLKIESDSDMKVAVELLSKLNQFNDKITEEKEKITKPLNEALKAERARWKPTELQNEEAITSIRSEMTRYQTALMNQKKQDEQKIADRVSKGTLKIENAVKKIEAIVPVEKNVSTDVGSVNFRTVRRFEILDLTQVPIEYHLANDSLITKTMKEGKELPGIRYYEEQVPANYR